MNGKQAVIISVEMFTAGIDLGAFFVACLGMLQDAWVIIATKYISVASHRLEVGINFIMYDYEAKLRS